MKLNPTLKNILTFNFILVGALPVLLIGLTILSTLTGDMEAQIAEKNLALARSLAGEVDRFLSEPAALMAQVASILEKKNVIREERTQDFLDAVIEQHTFLDHIWILDARGTVTHLAPYNENYLLLDMSARPFFSPPQTENRIFWSPPFISLQSGQPTLTLTRPFPHGRVVGYLNLAALNQITNRIRVGSEGYAMISDRKGRLIAHPNARFVSERRNIGNLALFKQAMAGYEGTHTYRSAGIETLGSVVRVQQTGWLVAVVQPADEAFAPVARIRATFWAGIILAVLLAAVMALFSLNKTLRPLSLLMANTRKVAAGHYDFPPQPGSYPEIDDLADDFRKMTGAVKARENALRESEDRFRSIVENSHEGILIADADFRLIYVNDELCKIVGRPAAEVLGQDFRSLLEGESLALVSQRYRQRQRGESPPGRYEFTVKRPDGQQRRVEVSASVIFRTGDRPQTIAELLDVTEQKQAEAQLRWSENRFRDLFNSISDIVYTQDLDGRFLTVNPALVSLFGYDEAELVGRCAADFMKPELRPRFYSDYIETLRTQGQYQGVSGYRRKSGERLYIEYNSALVTPAEGDPYISGTGRDVTERILAERQIKQLQEQMLQARKMEAIGTLAGGVAHDFNNLLMGVQGRVSLMLADIGSEHPLFEHVKCIETYVESATDLTRQLLGFARGGKYEVVPTDLNELIERQNRMFGRTRKEIAIHEAFQEDLWSVAVDRGQFQQVLLNLYLNAAQAMPSGGDLNIRTDNTVLDDAAAGAHNLKPGRYVRVFITDTGVGMDEATQQRIFEPFFTTKQMGRGTGLGLASTYGIVKNHGGTILVKSKKAAGTTFTIYLPASEQAVVASEATAAAITGGRETVLLIDDEALVLDVGRLMVEKLGYAVMIAESGEIAVDTYRKHRDRIDLVILDMIMPGMSGGETFDRLKAIDSGVKVILSSGYSINGQASRIMARGCNGFIQKPFSLQQLAEKITRVIGDNET